jgi:tetratricopeptide (TPR) repeat protein
MQESFEHFYEEDSLYHAINRFEDMIKSNSTLYFDVCEFEVIIDYYLDQHNFKIAEEAVSVGLNQHPASGEIKFRLAQLYIQSGKPSKGLQLLREIENFETTNSDFYLLKGSALNHLGKKEEANKAFDFAIKNAIENKDDVVFNIAFSYINTRRYKLALKYLKLAHEINPENISVIHEMALVYERIDDLHSSSIFYKKYLDLDPFNDNIWICLGMVYATLGNTDKAIESYDFAIAIHPDNISALFSKANTLVAIGENKEAVKVYLDVIDVEPDNVQAYTYIGECYEKLKFYKRSIYYFNRALQFDPQYGDAWYGLGIAHFEQGNHTESLKYFKKAKNIDPENPDFWFMLGEVYRKLQMLEKSAESFNRVVELDPNDHEAWLNRADLSYTDNADLKGAIRILSKAFEFNPENSSINYRLAVYFILNNQTRLGHQHFEKGLSIDFTEHLDYMKEMPTKSVKLLSTLINSYKNNSRNL